MDRNARRLILWDIDGTLLTTGEIGRFALERAAASVAGLTEVPHVVMGGKTDQRILKELMSGGGVPPEKIEELLPEAMALTIEILASSRDDMARDGVVHPGIGTVIDELAKCPNVRQSVVTGNLAPNARLKVRTLGLHTHIDFDVGAYGDDHHDRNELVPLALERTNELRGETYEPDEVWVIGDTSHDLACARAAKVRCLLVGTRWGSEEDVSNLDADAYFPDLADTERVLDTLLR